MKKYVLILGVLLWATFVHAQFGAHTATTPTGTHARFTYTGNLGIGTAVNTIPSEKLHVIGNTLVTGNLIFGTTASTGLLHLNSTTNNFNLRLNATDRLTILNSSGDVGIGTTSPTAKLHVNGNMMRLKNTASPGAITYEVDNGGIIGVFESIIGTPNRIQVGSRTNADFALISNNITQLTVKTDGKVGIGTLTPAEKLHVEGNSFSTGNVIFGSTASTGTLHLNSTSNDFKLKLNATDRLTVLNSNGYVGIGTTTPDERLTVNGTIHAKEVKVDLNVPGPDYVFEPDYKLLSLAEVELYIKQHKHLPEVPAAKEMEQNGVNLSEMNMLLLKKVEELTLYVLEQNKLNQSQSAEIQQLRHELNTLKGKNIKGKKK